MQAKKLFDPYAMPLTDCQQQKSYALRTTTMHDKNAKHYQ